MNTIQIPASLEGISMLKDGGMSLRFGTQEATPEQKLVIMNYYQQFGWLLFAAQEQDESRLKLEAIRKDTGGKSPSQRLRAVLFVLYTKEAPSIPFEQYYEQKVERFINLVKQNLEVEL